MLVAVVVTAATFVTVAVYMLMLVTMVVAAAAAFVTMTVLVLVIIYSIIFTMRMLRYMSHSLVVMILAAMAAGAALGMLAIIFNAVNAAINFLIAAHIISAVTDIFQIMHIFLHSQLPPFFFVLSSSY